MVWFVFGCLVLSFSFVSSCFLVLCFLALVLLFGPMLAIAVAWATLVAAGYLGGTGIPPVKEAASQWLAIVLAGAAACLASEWQNKPENNATGRQRPNFGLALSLGVGVGVATAAFFALRFSYWARGLLGALALPL